MTVSTQIQAVVVAWQIYDITHDPLSLGLMGLAEAFPYIGLSLFAGHVADSANRRRVALASIALLAVVLRRAARLQPDPGVSRRARRAAVLRGDLRERHRAQLRAAVTPSARRRADRASLVLERRRVAQLDVAVRGRRRTGARRIDLRLRVGASRVRRGRDHDDDRAGRVRVDPLRAVGDRRSRRVDRREPRIRTQVRVPRVGAAVGADARSLFGAARRRRGAAAGVRRSDSSRRTAGPGHSARRARGWRGDRVRVSWRIVRRFNARGGRCSPRWRRSRSASLGSACRAASCCRRSCLRSAAWRTT